MVFTPSTLTLLICLIIISALAFLKLGPNPSSTRFLSRGPTQTWIIIEPSWLGTPSPSSMLQFFIYDFIVNLTRDTSESKDEQGSAHSTGLPTIFSHLGPLLRSLVINIQNSCAVLLTFERPLTQCQEALFCRLHDIGISKTLLVKIIRVYQSILGHLHTPHDLSNFIKSTIKANQGCHL